ncbi:hypothetical protein [Bacteroides fragilis]|uniref:hypothetical protein n=1 Tax=Bacteroides fragilis TaxID=817 RepID=UPI00203083CE|nr:hypothetical protein [Bacteroides fragilis]MCM0314285.1 hypothetical protein [Bacteroides fragilis]
MKAELYKELRQSEQYMEMLETGIKALSELLETFDIANKMRENTIVRAHGFLTIELNDEKENYKRLIKQLDN